MIIALHWIGKQTNLSMPTYIVNLKNADSVFSYF